MGIIVCELAKEKVMKLEENFKLIRLCEKWNVCPLCGNSLVPVGTTPEGRAITVGYYKCQNDSCNYMCPA